MTEWSTPFSVTTDTIALSTADAATAADAAVVQQLAVEPFLKEFTEARIIRHPSASLHADVVNAIIPAIEVFAAHKNVAVAAHEYETLAHHALKRVSRKTLRLILVCNENAIKNTFSQINRTLDVLGAARLMAVLIAAEGREVPDTATLFRMGDESMKAKFANDKAPTMCIWPDAGAIATEHGKRISQQPTQLSILTMPYDAVVQCAVRQATKGWGAVIRAATPLSEGATYE